MWQKSDDRPAIPPAGAWLRLRLMHIIQLVSLFDLLFLVFILLSYLLDILEKMAAGQS